MRTLIIEKTVYAFDELSDEAKDAVKNRLNDCHNWGDDHMASLRAFAAQFGVNVTNWEYGPWSNADISTDASAANFRGFTLKAARALPEFPTGYCADYTLREVFIREFERTGNAFAAFTEAMDAGIKEARADWESQWDDEYMSELCEANAYEFYEDGEMIC